MGPTLGDGFFYQSPGVLRLKYLRYPRSGHGLYFRPFTIGNQHVAAALEDIVQQMAGEAGGFLTRLQFLRKQPKAANLRNKKRLFTQPNS
jgi:hypothetical protein